MPDRMMQDLQHYSRCRQIYYWFGNAYAVFGKNLRYIASEEVVKNALVNGDISRRPWVNEVLAREKTGDA